MALEISKSQLFTAHTWCVSGFSARGGGVSTGPFSSLNQGLHVGDELESVLQNRARVADRLGFSLGDMVCAAQIHGGDVAVVDGGSRGRGATRINDALGGVDALVTDTPGILLTLFFADCIPVLLADSEKRVIAVVHAGWRGVVSDVVENTIGAMVSQFGSEPKHIVAAIGPGIGPCCFEVGEEVAVRFPLKCVSRAAATGRPYVNLAAAVRARLLETGLWSETIDELGGCTACDSERFFSHRRDGGKTGRMAAVIAIR